MENIESMKNLIDMVRQFSNTSENTDPTPSQKPIELDELVTSEDMNLIKVAIPYMNLKNQKQIAVLIKILELKKTIELYNDESTMHMSELNKVDRSKSELLHAIKNQSTDKNKQYIDVLLNILTLKNLTHNPTKTTEDPQLDPNQNEDSNISNHYEADNKRSEELALMLKNLAFQRR